MVAGHHDDWHHESEWLHHDGAAAKPAAAAGELHESHAGFLSVARLLSDQGIWHPAGEPALASQLAQFFEDRMADLVAGGIKEDAHAAAGPPLGTQLAEMLSKQVGCQ